jgi:hypothetical protein
MIATGTKDVALLISIITLAFRIDSFIILPLCCSF